MQQNIQDFIRDLFTLRTVWIDKGSGRWTVKKRFHPLLRSICWTLALIVCAGLYASINTVPEKEAEAVIASLPEPVKTLPEPEPEDTAILIPQTVRKIVFPSDINPDIDRIIMPPVEKPEIAEMPKPEAGKFSIEVNKSEYTLSLYRGEELVKTYPVAVGRNPGDKQRVGDNRTPTGNFKIVSIENASKWSHDFRDGKGKIAGAYGPWFLRLDAKGWKGIGIHGTHDPDSRGTNATEGCIRLSNEDIAELRQYAYRNMPVTIREN